MGGSKVVRWLNSDVDNWPTAVARDFERPSAFHPALPFLASVRRQGHCRRLLRQGCAICRSSGRSKNRTFAPRRAMSLNGRCKPTESDPLRTSPQTDRVQAMRATSAIAWLFVTVTLLAGCASSRAPLDAPTGERILYETRSGPFCGRCDSLKLTVSQDGQISVERGHWAGHYADWRIRKQSLRVPPEQTALFRQSLAPYRPTGTDRLDGPPHCATLTDDLPGISVTWYEVEREDHLWFDFACDAETHAAMWTALRDAPALVGVLSPLAAGPTEPTAADIAVLERKVRLPPDALALRAYARYYALHVIDGRSTIVGSYLLDAPDPPGRYIRRAPVEVFDGGCAVVTIYFDVRSRRATAIYCNGVA